jgi:hypothetical protein
MLRKEIIYIRSRLSHPPRKTIDGAGPSGLLSSVDYLEDSVETGELEYVSDMRRHVNQC